MKHLQVETTSVCNAHCVFCPHDKLEQGHMEQWLYEKIVKDASQYDLVTFSPMMTGEPFCDPEIMERVKFARMILKPDTIIRFFTNGSLMTLQDIDELARMRNIEVSVSLNGACRETRQRLMGVDDFDKVATRVWYMKEKGMNIKTSFVLFPTITTEEIKAFGNFPNPYTIRFQSFAGHIYHYKRFHGRCRRVENYLTVLRDGRVCLCCFDAFGNVIFGDLKEQTIAEVLESKERNKYVKANHEDKINQMRLCSECTEGD